MLACAATNIVCVTLLLLVLIFSGNFKYDRSKPAIKDVFAPLVLWVVSAGRQVHATIPGTDYGGFWDRDPWQLMAGATWTPLDAQGRPTTRAKGGNP